MSLSTTELDNQEKLKRELHNAPKASKLEHLAAALIGRLLDVPIAVAKSGFQHGADAGPAGQQGRRFRVECKKYNDNSRLSERELLGEIDQALTRDKALEAWVLVATCSVSEQIRQSLVQHGEKNGIPIVLIDWVDGELAPLAALCAFAPDLVEREFSREAGAAACAPFNPYQSKQSKGCDAICNLGAWDLKQYGRVLTISSTKFGTRRKNRRLHSDKTRLGVLRIRRSNATRCIRH